MTQALRGALLGLGVVGLMAVAGCSGSGVAPDVVSGGDVKALAADHLSAVALLRGWIHVLFEAGIGTSARPFDVRAAQGEDSGFEQLPDGSYHVWGKNSDGSAYDYIIDRPDGTGGGTLTGTDGSVTRYSWKVITRDEWGAPIVEDYVQEYPDGTVLSCRCSMDMVTYEIAYDGALRLTDGRSMRFLLNQLASMDYALTASLPDGSSISATFPCESGDVNWVPRFAAGVEGTYRGPSGAVLSYRLSGDAEAWTGWRFSTSDGCSGDFTLSSGLCGTGEMRSGSSLAGGLRWDVAGFETSGVLDLLSTAASDVSPTAAARDFAIDRWIRNSAMLGPMPMY